MVERKTPRHRDHEVILGQKKRRTVEGFQGAAVLKYSPGSAKLLFIRMLGLRAFSTTGRTCSLRCSVFYRTFFYSGCVGQSRSATTSHSDPSK